MAAVPETKVKVTGDVSNAVSAIGKLRSELGGLQSFAAKALSFAGIGIGAAEIVRLADTYGQLTARLQLATTYTGDFDKVQKALAKSAESTRSSLEDTIDLYTKLSNPLAAMGRSGEQSVGIITTVNKAIALSGVSAEAAAAGILQFGQALGAGRLGGEELNSILENTPGLADAIAEGLGVARGELKKLGSDGKLTARVVVEALEKVAARVDTDFAKLPLSVGQALTLLKNSFTQIIGGTAQASGAMGALARAIVVVSDSLKTLSADQNAGAVVTFLTEAFDGLARVVRISGAGIAALAAGTLALFRGNLAGAKEIASAYAEDVKSILTEPLQRDKINKEGIVASDREFVARRLELQQKLQTKTADLEKLRAIAAGKASADILLDDAKRTDAQIKNAEKLRDALRAAWQTSLEDAKKAGDEAKKFLDSAAATRQSGADRARDIRRAGLSQADQDALNIRDFRNIASEAENAATLSRFAALQGRTENAAKLADQATAAAERASRLVDRLGDPEEQARAVERLTDAQATADETRAKIKQQAAKALEEQAAAQANTLRELDAQLTELQARAAAIDVKVQIDDALAAINQLNAEIAAIPRTITLDVETRNSGAPAASSTATFAVGGYTGPGGKYQPAGIVHRGEYVLPSEVVRQAGMLSFLRRLHAQGAAAIPGYAAGGLVGRLSPGNLRPAGPAAARASATFNFPDMGSYQASLDGYTFDRLQRDFQRAALQKGGRR